MSSMWRSLPTGMPVSLVLIAINALMYFSQGATSGQLQQLGVLYGPAVAAGEDWRLVSSGFLHGSLLHIAFNMVLVYALGQQLEPAIGSLRFTLLYSASLLGGALAVMLFDWRQPTLGASGAVLGIAAGFAIALWAQGNDPRQSPIFGLVILNLALPLLLPGISFWGHAGGVIAGAACAWILVWYPIRRRPRQAAMTRIATPLAGLALVVSLALAGSAVARIGGL